jgi:hypothetical protein
MNSRQMGLLVDSQGRRPPAETSERRAGPFAVPPGDFARPGLVDRAFVARSVAAFRADPDARYGPRRLKAADSLREDLAQIRESLEALNRVYRACPQKLRPGRPSACSPKEVEKVLTQTSLSYKLVCSEQPTLGIYAVDHPAHPDHRARQA